MGPHILKRLTPVPPTGSLGSATQPLLGAALEGPQPELQGSPGPVPATVPVQPSPPASSTGRPRHPDPFRLWPAPSEPTSEGLGAEAAPGPRSAAGRTPVQVSRAGSRAVSRRGSMHPAASDLHPSDALEGEQRAFCCVETHCVANAGVRAGPLACVLLFQACEHRCMHS